MSEQVHQMFTQIAPRYDATNDVLSMGIHRLWRRDAVRLSGAQAGDAVLDCATGTGDLALAFKRAVGPTGCVLGTDFNADMLAFAPEEGGEARARGEVRGRRRDEAALRGRALHGGVDLLRHPQRRRSEDLRGASWPAW